MKKWNKWLVLLSKIFGVVLFTALVLMFFLRQRYPVFILMDGDCACTDYSTEVEGITILNPFRNRTPELLASRVLEDVNNRHCPKDASEEFKALECKQNMEEINMRWKLQNRKDEPHKISLFYKFDRPDCVSCDRFSGEGMILLKEKNGVWKADSWDVIW